jgi:hypothetical protein
MQVRFLDSAGEAVPVSELIGEGTLMRPTMLSQIFLGWLERCAVTASGIEPGPGVVVSDGGGEIRYYIRGGAGAWYTVSRAERSEAERVVMKAAELADIERYLTVALAAELRQREQLPALLIPGGAEEYAAGFSGEHRDGFVWLDDGRERGPLVAFIERDPYRPNLAVQFSHYRAASIDEIAASAASPTGTPLFAVRP